MFIITNKIIAQYGLSFHFGGSNFLGATINFQKEITKNNNRKVLYSAGLGYLLPGWDEPTNIINLTADYKIKNFGIGIEGSKFFINPYLKLQKPYLSPFIDILAYPNIDYNINVTKNMFIEISLGAYFAFTYNRHYKYIDFEGDVIPGAGLSVGYRL